MERNMNPIEKLCNLLTEADIPFYRFTQTYTFPSNNGETKTEAFEHVVYKVRRKNQFVESCMFDAARRTDWDPSHDILETWGPLGWDRGENRYMSPEDAFVIISNNWEKTSDELKKRFRRQHLLVEAKRHRKGE